MMTAASVATSGDDTFYVNSYGGGIYVGDGTLDATDVAVIENSADQGGGLYLDSASVVAIAQQPRAIAAAALQGRQRVLLWARRRSPQRQSAPVVLIS